MDRNQKAPKDDDTKRLFFGAQVEAPWPREYPQARIIDEKMRHITLAFLGQNSLSHLQTLLSSIPHPTFHIGPTGIADELIFLPPKMSRVAAVCVKWLETPFQLNAYQKTLCDWLNAQDYSLDERPFFPHITIARSPFEKKDWQEKFSPLPFYVRGIHLYESIGNLQYRSIWQWLLLPPFEELEHTADIAFLVRGTTLQELYLHAQVALAFEFPPLIHFFDIDHLPNSLDEIIISLNAIVTKTDTEFGCPFKAVSFHGKIKNDPQNFFFWEMIVDV